MRESRDSDRFLVNTQVQSHALLRRGFGTSVPFIFHGNHGYYSYGTGLETDHVTRSITVSRAFAVLHADNP